jgi:hypothetical protein
MGAQYGEVIFTFLKQREKAAQLMAANVKFANHL